MADSQSAAAARPAEWLQAPRLAGQWVALEPLEPLTPAQAAALSAGADAATVAFLSRGSAAHNTPEQWAAYIGRLNAVPQRVNWAVLRGAQAVGRISSSEVRPADCWAEIGTTLLPAAQGTQVNPEANLLLLDRAFTVLGAGRVHLKVAARNARSRAAMRKLGAVEEGTLRQYQVRPDGHARHSVMFLRAEWPQVRLDLLERLGLLDRLA